MLSSIERMRLYSLERLVREEQLHTVLDACRSPEHKFEMKGFDEYFRDVLCMPLTDLSLFTQERCTDKALNEQHNYDNNFNVV